MAEFDVVIKDGTIIDGTKVPRYRADLGIKNGKVAKIGRLQASDQAFHTTPQEVSVGPIRKLEVLS